MFRFLALFCCAAVIVLSNAFLSHIFAQDENIPPGQIKATPEMIALLEQAQQSLAQAEPGPKTAALFQLLGFAVLLDDKTQAENIVNTLTTIAADFEPEELRSQLYEGIASALSDLEKYDAAVAILQKITDPDARFKSQLNLAVKLVLEHEQDESLKPFDATELLKQTVSAITKPEDQHAAALANSLLGREFARQGKTAESAAAFAEAISIAQKTGDIREQIQIMQLILQSQVLYGQLDAARATVQTKDDPEIKRTMTGALIHALIQHEQYLEAEALIKTLPADGAGRDMFVQRWVVANIESVTETQVGELSALMSAENRERFLQAVVAHLQKIDRGEVAIQVSKRLQDTAGAERALFTGKMEMLLEKENFDEAIRIVTESKEDTEIKNYIKRQVLKMQFDATRDETVIPKIMETYTAEDQVAITELNVEADKTSQIESVTERFGILFEIVQDQFSMADIAGAKSTLKLISEQLGNVTDPVQSIDYRLMLAQFQCELRDNDGVKANIGALVQMLTGIEDLTALKALIQDESAALDESVIDESAIRSQLFRIYTMASSLLTRAEASAEARSAFEKAKTLAESDSNPARRAEKLLTLAQLLTQ